MNKYPLLSKRKKKLYQQQYFQKNKENIYNQRKASGTYGKRSENNKSIRECTDQEVLILRKQRRDYYKKRYNEDLLFRLSQLLRKRLSRALKANFKTGSSVKDLGCSIEELKKHLESKFQEGMSWNNYGEWQIDHIIALTKFNLSIREELLKACHYTNLQPLWKKENISKGNK